MPLDSSTYIRKLQCCSSLVPVPGPTGPAGPQGPQGPTGLGGTTENALLFFSNITITKDTAINAEYDHTTTVNNGVSNYLNGTGATAEITFANAPTENALVEFYFHGDAAGVGNNTFTIADLVATSAEPNSLTVVDIDTRSVGRANPHMAFGPTCYKILANTTAATAKCIHKNNRYRLRLFANQNITMTELKLVIKIRYF